MTPDQKFTIWLAAIGAVVFMAMTLLPGVILIGNESPWAYWYQLVTICYLGGRHAGNVLRDD